MATKKIQIEFDLNTNEVKLAGEATMSLAQQVRILQKELSKTPEGTKEFELLRRKLNDTKDNFDRVNAKSRELFGTLSLLPGPVGDIAGKLNGAISLMKTFSGFSFKDIGNQFKGLVDDIKGILMALGSWGESSKQTIQANDKLGDSLTNVSNDAVTAGAALTSATRANIKSLEEKIQTEQTYQNLLREEIKTIRGKVTEDGKITSLTKEQRQEKQKLNQELNQSIEYEKTYTRQLNTATGQIQNTTKETDKLTNAQKAQNVAVNAGRNAWTLFKGVLSAVGIGVLIGLVSELVGRLYEFVTGTKAAEQASKNFSDALQEENYWLNKSNDDLKNRNEERILQLRASGASAAQIREEETNQLRTQLLNQQKIREEAFQKYSDAVKGENVEIMDAAREEYRKREADFVKAESDLRKKQIQNKIDEKKDLETAEKEKTQISEKARNDREQKENERIAKEKARLDAAIQLEINSENTRQDVLEGLLEERFKLEKGSAAELELLHKEHQKKVSDALNEDYEKRRQNKIKDYEALAEIERNQQDVDVERLIKILEKKRDLETQELNLTEEQKLAIIKKYEADFSKLRQDAREKELVESIQANQGNFDKQIELYRQFANEVVTSTTYSEGEKLRIIEETNQKILQLQQQRLDNEKNVLDLSLQNSELTYTEYYDKLDIVYENEIARYKKLYEQKQITEAEYNANIKKLTDARIQIRQQELDAQIKTFQAIGEGLGAISQLVGEQTKAGKGLAVAASLINTYAAIAGQLRAFAGLPIPGYAIAQAIATGLVGFAQVRKIIATPIPQVSSSQAQFSSGMINVNQRRAQGGFITGPGGETSDSVPAMLSNGEFVINSRSTRVFRPLLETINSASNLPQFAAGGLVRESMGSTPFKSQNETIAEAINTAFGQTPIKTYVTATDVSTQQQFERVIKSRSLI